MSVKITLEILKRAVGGTAAAFRCVTDYQPAGGVGDKVFPPTYEGGKYATEERIDPETGEVKQCVLLDSVQSQANRMELALLDVQRAGKVELPLLLARFDDPNLDKKFTVTSLEAPHRIADALFRDSLLDGVIFRKSDKGRLLDTADIRNATGLFGLCPSALVFGLWDSTGPRGGLGCKFQRAIVSEIVGYDAIAGIKTSSRLDPAAIEKHAGPVFRSETDGWTLTPDNAKKGPKGKPVLYKANSQGKDVEYDPSAGKDVPDQGRPSILNHGNVKPSISAGGFTISKARQTTTLSLSVLRRLRFPLNGDTHSEHDKDLTARTTLAALGLAAGSLARTDTDLRSRCQLFAEQEPIWELLERPGETHQEYELGPDEALNLLQAAIVEAKAADLPWEGEIELAPSSELVELVRRSQELESTQGTG